MGEWKLYYSDGSTFSYEDGTPDQAPRYGLLIVTQNLHGRQEMLFNQNFYFHVDGEWFGMDEYGVRERLSQRLPVQPMVQGRYVSARDFSIAYRLATHHGALPPVTR
jgi:hypothetical protein